MKISLIKLAAKVLDQSVAAAAMSRLRYFPNKAQDFQYRQNEQVNVPEKEIKAVIFDIMSKIGDNVKPTEKNATDGLYLGTAGIAYMYYHLSKLPIFSDHRDKFLSQALEYLKPALKVCQKQENREKDRPSFILGNGGVYAVAAAIFNATGDATHCNKYVKLYNDTGGICKNPRFLNCGSDELFVGRAGYICGAMWMANETKTSADMDSLHDLCRTTVQSGRDYSKYNNSPSPLMYSYYDVEYLGAAHGLCSILQYLMTVPKYLELNPRDAKDIKTSIDYLLSLQSDEGNFPAAMDELGQQDLVHWCHGAGGVVYLMAKAYLVWREEKYLVSCRKAADLIWAKGLLRKGPGICHGVAGNGYVFLLMHRLTGDQKYLHRAVVFFNFMCSEEFKKARTPDYPYSLYEGMAGTACFLGDTLCIQQAHFPFSDVF